MITTLRQLGTVEQVHPYLSELLRKIEPVFVNEQFQVIDQRLLIDYLGEDVSARDTVLLLAALADAGLVAPKFEDSDPVYQIIR